MKYIYWHPIIQLCLHGVTAFVRSLSSASSDLLRPSSFSLGCLSPSGGFSVPGCPQGEMTELGGEAEGERVSGLPWIEGGEEKCPRRVITLGNLVSVPLSVSPLSASSCSSHISQGRDTPVCPFNAACSGWDRSNNSH